MRIHTPVNASVGRAVVTGALITSATGVAVLVPAENRRSMSCSVRMPTGLQASVTTTLEMLASVMRWAASDRGAVLPIWAMARLMMSARLCGSGKAVEALA